MEKLSIAEFAVHLFQLYGADDPLHGGLHKRIVQAHVFSSQSLNHFACLPGLSVVQQPAWRLWEQRYAYEKDDTKHTLEGNWEPPLDCMQCKSASKHFSSVCAY